MLLDWSSPGDFSQRTDVPISTRDVPKSFGPPLHQDSDINGFSSSLPILFDENLKIGSTIKESLHVGTSNFDEETMDNEEALCPLDEELVSRAIGDLLPDDEEELLAGIAESFGLMSVNNEENDDFDLFSSGGGLELDGETHECFGAYANNSRAMDGFYGNSSNFHMHLNGPGSLIGEHPYGEHPSRTLFVRNINSNVEDMELRALFEQYGDIRTLYTACKHRGFVMISYYDIRAARSAMRALQNKPLRRRKLDIHFSIPKDNPSDKDINQGTLVVFNLDASVSNDDLRHIFGQYGEVKEIRETPHKRHHKFIEFYDVRAAESALRALNRSDIAGKRIKLEPSRPGGARRSLTQQLSQDLEEESRLYWPQSSPPVASSPPSHWGNFGSPIENGPFRSLNHSVGAVLPGGMHNPSASLHSASMRAVRGSHLGRSNQIDAAASSLSLHTTGVDIKGLMGHHAHSLPEYNNCSMPPFSPGVPLVVRDGVEGSRLPQATSGSGHDASFFDHIPGALKIPTSGALGRLNSSSAGGSPSLSGPQVLWGSSGPYHQTSLPVLWQTPAMGNSLTPPRHAHGYTGSQNQFVNATPHRYHPESAPSGDPSYLERHHGYTRGMDTSVFGHGSLGVLGNSGAGMMAHMNSAHSVLNSGMVGSSIGFDNGGGMMNLGMMSPHYHRGPILSTIGIPPGGTRRPESGASQVDNKKQYQLDIDRILSGEDSRTTLMIKNIPNKYTSKMLLAAIDENHRGMYDFLYLPIDFKNKCNVGYAFINMTSPAHIIPIYKAFNGKKWEKFNSEKVASLAYARIQGQAALAAHFQNSSLMNEDKRCRPILFHSEGIETGDQAELGGANSQSRGGEQLRNGGLLERVTSLNDGRAGLEARSAGLSMEGTVLASSELNPICI